MLITAAKSDLLNALQVVGITLGSGGSDLSTHYLFRVRDGKCEVLSYNQRVCASAFAKCQFTGNEGDALTVEGWRLDTWLQGIGDVPVTLEDLGSGVVKASSPKSNIRLKSLDPAKFPFWDNTLNSAIPIAQVKGIRLAGALDYVKRFISDKDASHPELAQTEILNGSFWATNKRAVAIVTLSGLEKSNLRVHGKDIGAATKFLSLQGTDTVEIREHERQAFFVRPDGAVLGIARPLTAFPTLKVDREGPAESEWEIRSADLQSAISCLTAAGVKDDGKLHFAYDQNSKKVILSVECAAGGRDQYEVDCIDSKAPEAISTEGFQVDHSYLTDTVGLFKLENLRMLINAKGKLGYVRLRNELRESKDPCLTVVVWR